VPLAFAACLRVAQGAPAGVSDAPRPEPPAEAGELRTGAIGSAPGPASGRFLVASQNLPDPRFAQTVVLLVQYSRRGATGLVINRPTAVKLSEVFPDMKGVKERSDIVYMGGPVAVDQMLVLVRTGEGPGEAERVLDDVYLSASKRLLERLVAEPREGEAFRVYAGYAGWGPRQLDGEIARGDWLVTEGDALSVFDENPASVWRLLILRGAGKAVQLRPPCPGWRLVRRWSPARLGP
jgi:putative transcriptional regulator